VGIKEDLQEALEGAASLVKVTQVVAELARDTGVSQAEAAHWLALKGAHSQVPAYLLHPLGHGKEKLPLAYDEKGAMHYKKVYEALFDAAFPPKMIGALAILGESLSARQAPRPKPEPAWVRSEIQAFIGENDGAQSEPEVREYANDNDGQGTGILELREDKLLAAVGASFDDPLCIPLGGKADLKKQLCSSDPKTFTGSTFDKAWSALSTAGKIAVAGKETYAQGSENREQVDSD
jgi:hypothetical protein